MNARQLEHFSDRIVVTGAVGFVGSVMCTRLSEMGYNVIAVDNNSRGLNKKAITALPNIQYIERDCELGIADILENNNVTDVIHFAAATGDLTRPDSELNAINVGITQKIVGEMAQYPHITLTFPTTSLALKIKGSGYVNSKEAAMSWLLSSECPLSEENLLLYRFFNNSGAYSNVGEFRQKEVHCFPRMFRALMRREEFRINGDDYDTVDGTPSRDYVHVQDSVDYMIYRLHRHKHGDHFTDDNGFLCEVGRGDPHTVLEIINMLGIPSVMDRLIIPDIYELLNSFHGNLVVGPRRDFDCAALMATPSAKIFQWRPLKTLEDILVDTFNSYYNFSLSNPDYLEQIKRQDG